MPTDSPKTRAQLLAQDMELLIRTQALAHGSPLGTLDSWRDQTGYARSTVSEALRLMIDRGTVEVRPGRGGGIFVAAQSPVVRLRHTLLTVHDEPFEVRDAIAIRDALEPLVDADAARYRTRSDGPDLRRALKAMTDAAGDPELFIRANWALHERIAQITPNHMLRAMYTTMTATISEHADRVERDESDTEYVERRLGIHRDLVEAIIAGDDEAVADAVARHDS